MATINDFIWTDSEISNMIRCFDSDRDGKVCLCLLIKFKYQSFSSESTSEKQNQSGSWQLLFAEAFRTQKQAGLAGFASSLLYELFSGEKMPFKYHVPKHGFMMRIGRTEVFILLYEYHQLHQSVCIIGSKLRHLLIWFTIYKMISCQLQLIFVVLLKQKVWVSLITSQFKQTLASIMDVHQQFQLGK